MRKRNKAIVTSQRAVNGISSITLPEFSEIDMSPFKIPPGNNKYRFGGPNCVMRETFFSRWCMIYTVWQWEQRGNGTTGAGRSVKLQAVIYIIYAARWSGRFHWLQSSKHLHRLKLLLQFLPRWMMGLGRKARTGNIWVPGRWKGHPGRNSCCALPLKLNGGRTAEKASSALHPASQKGLHFDKPAAALWRTVGE